jgi:hypothetical protein
VNTRANLNVLFEAASGDLDADGAEPVFIELKENCAGKPCGDVVRARLRVAERTMTVAYEALDAELTHEDVVMLFAETYLWTYTNHGWRADVDVVVITSSTSGMQSTHPYATLAPEDR